MDRRSHPLSDDAGSRGAMTLAFRLGAVRVRVHLWFVVTALLLGCATQRGTVRIAVWVAGFLFTLVAHELGHAVVARRFGVPAEVHLTLSRETLGSRIQSLTPMRRFAVSVAGPVVSLAIGAIALLVARVFLPGASVGANALRYLGWINVGWGAMNLLPMAPLDGRHALTAILDRTTKGRGDRPVRWVSFGCALALALVAVRARMFLPAVIALLVAIQNARGLRAGAARPDMLMRYHLRAAFDAIARDDAAASIGHCRSVLAGASEPDVRRDALRLLAYAYAVSETWDALLPLLESAGAMFLDDGEIAKYQAAALELGRADDARRIADLRTRLAPAPLLSRSISQNR
jgi:Zn-dependent protease